MYPRYLASFILILFTVSEMDAFKDGIPYGICDSFEIGHPPVERSDATVKLDLLESPDYNSVSCFKPGQKYLGKPTIAQFKYMPFYIALLLLNCSEICSAE